MFRFEWKRSRTVPRMAWWVVLTLLPPGLFLLIRLTAGLPPVHARDLVASIGTFALCPGVVCVMGVFLWATPAVTSELEGHSWVYLAVRPYGKTSLLIGKYIVAVAWTIPSGLISSFLSLLILAPEEFFRALGVESALVCLSCMAYAAVFALIGVVFIKRTMVIAIAYIIFVEVILASVPAVVNTLTIQFRLRCLGVRWMEMEKQIPPEGHQAWRVFFGEETAAWHLFILFAATVGLLAAAAFVLRIREFTSSAEDNL